MKSLLVIAVFLNFSALCFSQYTTPDNAVNWNLDSLVMHSEGVVNFVSESNYSITDNVIISASDNIIFSASNILISEDVEISVYGELSVECNSGSALCLITGADAISHFKGFRLEEGSISSFNDITVKFGGGFKVISSDFTMDNCQIEFCSAQATTGGIVELSQGKPIITNSVFFNNEVAAISSSANTLVAPIIYENTFESNVTLNTNRPQINLGPSGDSDTTFIIGNTIIGNQNNTLSGGIAYASFFGEPGHVVIQENIIQNNRYGITIFGNGLDALIHYNYIANNNIQDDPLMGGSGINLNGNETSSAIISQNEITGNLWGVTIQNTFIANLGDNENESQSPGLNTFDNNGNNDLLFALFNNTPNEVSAMHNCWSLSEASTLDLAESVISHNMDDGNLGEVFFDPILNCIDGINDLGDIESLLVLYPNPSNEIIHLKIPDIIEVKQLTLYNVMGKEVDIQPLYNTNSISIGIYHLPAGAYILAIKSSNGIVYKHLLIET